MFDRILPALSRFPLRPMLAAACLTASLSVSSPAAAAVVQNSFARGSIDVTLDRPGQAGQGVRVGGFSGTLDGVSFLSYCIDLAQHFTFGTVYTDHVRGAVASGPTTIAGGMGAARALDLARLAGAFFASSFATTTQTAAFQLAV